MLTFAIYQESNVYSLWAEEFLQKRPANLSLKEHIFLTLRDNSRSPDPETQPFFKFPVYMDTYNALIREMSAVPPVLGSLNRFL